MRQPPSKQPARNAPEARDPQDGTVRLRREKGGRGGKTATTITGLPGNEADLDALLKTLKQQCGAGGSRNGRTLEIQGDHRARLQPVLEAMGYRVKLAGG
ncbi:MAG TPA: translation initiation factor [Solirubrobacterales bacterium]|nr:translation initiation factor [Solirubrobacterales bacterium]